MNSPREALFKGTATPMAASALAAAASRINVEEAQLRAVLHVEAPNGGFDSKGRPTILFERHVFWRNLPLEQREGANRAGLASSHWEPGRYPRTSDAMYELLERACAIDEAAALKACSWGRPQILGENHRMVGFASVQEMVLAAMAGEAEQLNMMVAFIDAANLEIPLRMSDWEGFAQGYNGPQYARNRYHERLQEAYERFRAEDPEPVADPDTVVVRDEPRAAGAWFQPPPDEGVAVQAVDPVGQG